MLIPSLFRGALLCLCLILLHAPGIFAADPDLDAAKPNLPKELEAALSELLQAAPADQPAPPESVVNIVLRFVTATDNAAFLHPASREHGAGIFYRDVIRQPLRTVAGYLLDPRVPGETIYPSTVRRNVWLPGSDVLTQGAQLLDAPYPPAAPLVTRGREYEETTPELSSGCYYNYTLDRLFVLTSMGGRTALVTVSLMPEPSQVGLKGDIVGPDANWKYVYTKDKGTNLPMLGWAETYLYGSATVNVFIESAPGSKRTDIYTFKWAKAGWSGMNVVKPSHILAGVRRYLSGFKQIMESPKRPAPDTIAAWSAELDKRSAEELRDGLNNFAADLEQRGVGDDILSQPGFQAVLKEGGYAKSLSKENAAAELMKLRMREALGLSLPSEADSSEPKSAPGEPPSDSRVAAPKNSAPAEAPSAPSPAGTGKTDDTGKANPS